MNRMLTCLTLVMVFTGANSAAELETECSEISDAQQRLACYDARHDASADSMNTKETRSSEPGKSLDQAQRQDLPSSDQAAKAQALPEEEPEVVPSRTRTLFGDEVIELTTRVTAVRKGDRQKMVFRLENGEIWMQTEPRLLPIYEGDVVTIENATMGGYFLNSEKGVVTRVQRIAENRQ